MFLSCFWMLCTQGREHRLIRPTVLKLAKSSFLRVKPFAALFGLSTLYLQPPDPACRPGIAPPWYREHVLFMIMLPVRRWRVRSTLKESALLCPSRCYSSLGGLLFWRLCLCAGSGMEVKVEAAGVLAQITSPWIQGGDHQTSSLPSLGARLPGLIPVLTTIARYVLVDSRLKGQRHKIFDT